MNESDAFWLFDGNLAKKEAEKKPQAESEAEWTEPPPNLWGADVEVPDPDEPGFDPIDRAEQEPEDKPPAVFFDHVRKRGTR